MSLKDGTKKMSKSDIAGKDKFNRYEDQIINKIKAKTDNDVQGDEIGLKGSLRQKFNGYLL